MQSRGVQDSFSYLNTQCHIRTLQWLNLLLTKLIDASFSSGKLKAHRDQSTGSYVGLNPIFKTLGLFNRAKNNQRSGVAPRPVSNIITLFWTYLRYRRFMLKFQAI